MADGVFTSSLEQIWYKLFFSTLALPKNRGACVDAQKCHDYKEWLQDVSRLIQSYDWKSPWDSSSQEDQDEFEDGLKRSSDAKVMTILEMLVLTPD